MKERMKELKEKYVFVPTDKAANNIIVVCKHYYFKLSAKSLVDGQAVKVVTLPS